MENRPANKMTAVEHANEALAWLARRKCEREWERIAKAKWNNFQHGGTGITCPECRTEIKIEVDEWELYGEIRLPSESGYRAHCECHWHHTEVYQKNLERDELVERKLAPLRRKAEALEEFFGEEFAEELLENERAFEQECGLDTY